MTRRFSPDIDNLIEKVAAEQGVPASRLRAFVAIESGGNPGVRTGSYKGLLQLSDSEFGKHGGQGNVYDPEANLRAGAAKIKAEAASFQGKYGRPPTDADLYLVHQQGEGGYAQHTANPDRPAWQNMAATAEGRQKGEGWARQAIWGNVPDDVKAKYGSVDNMTSRDFMNVWGNKVERFGGEPSPAPENRGGSMNGGFGMSPTGTAGIAGSILTDTPVAADQRFTDLKPVADPEATPSIASSMLASLFGGSGANLSAAIGDSAAKAAPAPPSHASVARAKHVAPHVNIADLLKIINNRTSLGT